MKKFLSLVLALVMTMSLVTVSAGAKDFTDDKSITYDEAVAVMSEVKVIDGYTDGSFQPTTLLTRGAAAKIICNLILGPTTAAALGADTAPYSDVPVNHTFAGYIAYCQKTGIISGYADGTFKPAASLTGYAFMKMLLGALGYDSDVEGYTGANWSINVAKQAIAIGLAKGNDDFTGQAYVNREEACLYALNTLKATMVEYPQTTTVTVNGADVVLASARTEVAWGTALKSNDGNIKKDGYVQFAEKYFPNLELEVGEGIYGRPANTWKNKKSEIGTFTSIEPTYVYTESMDESDVYKDLGATITNKNEYDWSFYINGVEQKTGTIPGKNVDEEWAYTGEGTVTEIYVNDIEETVDVIEYNYYLGQVSKVKSDDDGEYITVSVLSKGATLDEKTFYVDGYEEDDYVVFTVDQNDDKDMVIGEVFEPETVTGTVTRVDKDDNTGATYLKMDSDKYIYTEDDADQQRHMVYNLDEVNTKAHPTLEEDYILYLDPNGYVLGFAPAEETVDQFLFVSDSDEELRDWIAKVYLPDGTNPKVDLEDDLNGTPSAKLDSVPSLYDNLTDTKYPIDFSSTKDSIEWIDKTGETNNDWKQRTNIDGLIWGYTVDSKGVYELTYIPVDDPDVPGDVPADAEYTQWYMDTTNPKDPDKTVEIHNGKAYVQAGVNTFIVDNKTIFVDTMNGTIYTGYKEVPNVDNAEIAYVLDGKIASVVFILDGDIYDSASTYFIIKDAKDRSSFKYDGDTYWTYDSAYVNGEKTPLNVEYNALGTKQVLKSDTLYKVIKTVDEDYITEVEEVTIADKPIKHVITVGIDAFWAAVNPYATPSKADKYDVNDETVYVVVDYALNKDGDLELDAIYDGRLDDMDDDDYDITVRVLKQDDETAELVYIFREEKAAPVDPKVSNVTFNGKEVSSYTSAEQAAKNPIEYAPNVNYTVDADTKGALSFLVTNNYVAGDDVDQPFGGTGYTTSTSGITVIAVIDTVGGKTDVKYIAVTASNDYVTLTIDNNNNNPVMVTIEGMEPVEVKSGETEAVVVKKNSTFSMKVEVGNNGKLGTVAGDANASVYGEAPTFSVKVGSASATITVNDPV